MPLNRQAEHLGEQCKRHVGKIRWPALFAPSFVDLSLPRDLSSGTALGRREAILEASTASQPGEYPTWQRRGLTIQAIRDMICDRNEDLRALSRYTRGYYLEHHPGRPNAAQCRAQDIL